MAILNDDVNQLETFLDNGANRLVQTATTVLVIGGTFLYISPLVAVFAFIPIPIIIFGSLRFTNRIAERYTKIRNDIENLNANLSNSITGILTVKSFNREKKESERITLSSNEVKSANYHAIRLSAAFIPIIRIAILFGFTATLLIGGFLALDGEIKVATYSVMLFITQRLLWPLTELGVIFDSYQKAMASFRRIINLKNTSPTINNGTEKLTSFNKKIEISNLNFEYVKNFPVLNDISIDINKGQTTAIVGSTGSGKSTLLRIMAGLNQPSSGSMLWNSEIIKNVISTHSTRVNYIGHLASVKLALTVEEDIRFWMQLNGNSKQGIMEIALERFGLLNQRSMPIRFLSSGQQRKLALTRLIVRDSKIWLLDEPTVGLDSKGIQSLEDIIHKQRADNGIVVVASHTDINLGNNIKNINLSDFQKNLFLENFYRIFFFR